MHRLQELVRLHRMGGDGVHGIAGKLGMSPNTERRYRTALTAAGLLVGSLTELPELAVLRDAVSRQLSPQLPPQQLSSLEHWAPRAKQLLGDGLQPKAIHDRLRLEEPEYQGSIGAVKRLVRRLKRQQPVAEQDVAIPVDTKPGQIAQVDFGYAGYLRDPAAGKERKAWVFVMVLGHSRHLYLEVVFDQSAQTWVQLHERAFAFFGGVPEVIVPDNLKAAVIKAAFSSADDADLNRTFCELARHYGFKIAPTPPRAPKKKGKVESSVKYAKRNFLKGRSGQDLDFVNTEARRWALEIAGTRDHGTTGKAPLTVFEREEQGALLPLPSEPYRLIVWRKATLHQDSHFHFDGRLYSVPWTFIAPKSEPATVVWVRATASTVEAFVNDCRVADHQRHGPGPRSTRDDHLPAHRREHRHRDPDYWRQRADILGPNVRKFIDTVLEHDPVRSRVDTACACVAALEALPPERAQSVATHALRFGNVHLRELKRIIDLRLDAQSTLPAAQTSEWSDAAPVFARSGADFAIAVAARERLSQAPSWSVTSAAEVPHGWA